MRPTLPGLPYPLGATLDSGGVNFALFSEHATSVELCLFDDDDKETRIPVHARTAFIWHVYVPDLPAGTRYGYRVAGAYQPEAGHRFNDQVVLLDPYARALDGDARFERGCFAYELGGPSGDLVRTDAPQLGAPRGVVVDATFDWEDDAPLGTALHRSIIYEAHVRGLTMRHPEVPENMRGTYSGVAHPAIIRHLRELGITAIELMPVHAFVNDQHLREKGLRNYWGYNSIGFFAPDPRYKSAGRLGSEVSEFKGMVKALHRAGIEVILDVVYNHTAEGNHLGPSFSFRGIDNKSYYRLVPEDQRYYFDTTGTGNTLNVRHPQVLALIMDSLRYWVDEMHVDGFRFDLAASLARQLHEVDQLSSFFTLIHQAPNLRQAKLIAEPWDLGEGGYQVGNFPVRWAEWNGRYRDAVRKLWKGDGGLASEIGYRLTGSSDLYEASGRSPSASVNFVTAHDGFTLRDLVSFAHKHNEANREENRDGSNDDSSFNGGVEGPTQDVGVRKFRARQQRNLLATLFLSQGTPMLLGGDEMGRSQRGNNNAYCQDNEISWLEWELDEEASALLEFTKRLIGLRRAHPALHRTNFFRGMPMFGTELHDLRWFRPDGDPMSGEDWHDPTTRQLTLFLAGRGINDVDEYGRPLVDDNLAILINAGAEAREFRLPSLGTSQDKWQLLLDTNDDDAEETRQGGEASRLAPQSIRFFASPSRVYRTGGTRHSLGATYRLQLGSEHNFAKARELTGYLQDLGVTDIYVSPIMAAARGSTHGYDVVDHGRLDPKLGAREDFEAWSSELQRRGMGLLVDWVPNHMGIASGQNLWWDDVLENGPSSAYAEFFDIDWSPIRHDLQNRVLLPILGKQYGDALEAGEIQLVWEDRQFRVAYGEHRLPVGPKTLVPLLEQVGERSGLPEDDEDRQELESIASAMRNLPEQSGTEPEQRRLRGLEKEVIKRRLTALMARCERVSSAVRAELVEFNGKLGDSLSFDALDAFLGKQAYRLASWQVASEEINYRRFFDINGLAAIRMESSEVFERSHALLFELMDQGHIDALRLDHTDGLYDPLAYFESLQRRFDSAERRSSTTPDDLPRPVPLLVEKILEGDETLPATWPIDGTTGYEFSAAVTALWVDPAAEEAFSRLYAEFTLDDASFEEHVYRSKLDIVRGSLASEVNMLSRELWRIAGQKRQFRDFTLASLTRALTEVLAEFPVYRSYLRPLSPQRSEGDVAPIRQAVARARQNPALSGTLFDYLERVLTLSPEILEDQASPLSRRIERAALAFQQLTSPVKAKAVEDTVFYRYTRLLCANEVGSSPGRFGAGPEAFHRHSIERLRAWPLSMTSTATHDSKLGEDARARIAVLTEMPDLWARTVRTWQKCAERHMEMTSAGPAPARTLQYAFFQALVGVWPYGWDGESELDAFTSRLAAYLEKAAKEAKEQTSWTSPHAAYDQAVARFAAGMLGDRAFRDSVRAYVRLIEPYGASNGFAQTVLKLCCPGIPDTYQGSEFYGQSLVDPDNRTPVDYEGRIRSLRDLIRRKDGDRVALCRELIGEFQSGRLKQYLLHCGLHARQREPELFLRGDYDGLPASEHVVAFTRGHGEARLVCATARLSYQKTRGQLPFAIGEVWGRENLRVPHAGTYEDVFTGKRLRISRFVRLAELFEVLPVALLMRVES